MNDDEKLLIGNLVRTYMSEKGISREGFAYKAGISVASVNNIVRGILTEKMLDKVEHNLGYKFRSKVVIDKIASELKGGYKFSDVEKYCGFFELVRYDFQNAELINIFAMKIDWDEANKCLSIFHLGIDGSDFHQGGDIQFPPGAAYFFIVSNDGGWQNDCIFEKMDFERRMDGCILSLGEAQRRMFKPTIAMAVLRGVGEATKTRQLRSTDNDFMLYNSILDDIDPSFVNFSGFRSGKF